MVFQDQAPDFARKVRQPHTGGETVVVKGRHFVEFRPAATALTIVQA
jgi:hypothetical protein